MSYKETNKMNLKALIDFIQSKPGGANSIDYISAGRIALLGKGHAQDDQKKFNQDDCYKGKVRLSIGKNKSGITNLSFVVDGKLYKGGKTSPQTGGRGELESEIQAAVPSALASVPVNYQWL